MNHLRLYLRLVGISIRAQMEYRASFFLQTVAQILITCMEFVAVWAVLGRFGNIRGWILPEICFFYGTANAAFAIGEAFSRGFDQFATFVRGGDFDRVLLRPCPTVVQLLGHELTLRRVGRLAQALTAISFGFAWLPQNVHRRKCDVADLGNRLRRDAFHRHPHHSGNRLLLDNGIHRNDECANLWRRFQLAISALHLSRLVPEIFYVHHAVGGHHVFPRSRRPWQSLRLADLADPIMRPSFPAGSSANLAIRHPPVLLDGNMTLVAQSQKSCEWRLRMLPSFVASGQPVSWACAVMSFQPAWLCCEPN